MLERGRGLGFWIGGKSELAAAAVARLFTFFLSVKHGGGTHSHGSAPDAYTRVELYYYTYPHRRRIRFVFDLAA